MSFAANLDAMQAALREAGLDGWLFYDHHHRDPISYRILGLPENAHVTRRWYYLIPAVGEPRKLVHRIEAGRLDTLPGTKGVYSSWQELESGLATMLRPFTKLAMQYSPRNAIMYVSMVDAGTVEFLHELGKTIVSSADLVSQFEAVLSTAAITSHFEAQAAIDSILAEGFREIGRRVRPASGAPVRTTEYDIVQWLSEAMRREGLTWENGPNVSVNENSSDSHYEPTAEGSKEIKDGDFVLIDIWGRKNRPETCYYDITWTGVVGREPSAEEQKVFSTVIAARDAAIQAVTDAYAAHRPIAGWQADDACRKVIADAGYGEWFTHRTGHNIGFEIHGSGAHLDNLETHDERLLLPHTCFSVEPGIYLPSFGVRSEIDMITSNDKAVVTGRIQTELVRI
ncbi:M24 family metallopeptidase [Silvibacterium dinghuense]|uniref:Aminopeptidase P family protein n=1 Tax=Silvibacterium dinghuense TaxID=1560006 RepID=A0A4Q1SIB8_9BACT|nr:Xaa-Pro peptidase family protein [Silvibacterium dinghuense]RXS97336.1 aminopeptidase P family protein [Silvibacterium dinghuense]GGG98158.1 peptidase M24 [Silvibacterium dinghuense]